MPSGLHSRSMTHARDAGQTAQAQLGRARELQNAGEPRAAIDACHAALGLGAPAAEVHLQLGVLHHTLSEYEIAIAHLEKVVAEQPSHVDALCMLGIVLNDFGQFARAQRLFERALSLRPDSPEALFNLGLARYETGD